MRKYLRTGVKVKVMANISDNFFLVCLREHFSVLGSSPGLGLCTNRAGASLSPFPVILEFRMSSWASLFGSPQLPNLPLWGLRSLCLLRSSLVKFGWWTSWF